MFVDYVNDYKEIAARMMIFVKRSACCIVDYNRNALKQLCIVTYFSAVFYGVLTNNIKLVKIVL